jgi:DNA-binding GntR family transcriptional regulator
LDFFSESPPTQWAGEQSLREKVLEKIRFAVVSGESPPGTVLSVPGVAKQLGISTTPVREALLELCSDGLIAPMRNRGFRVVQASLQDLRDLFAMREQLETYAVGIVAATGLKDKARLEELAGVVGEAVQKGDMYQYLSADRAFHQALVSQAGNRLLTDTVMRLRDNMRLYGLDSEEGLVRQHASVKEHYHLVKLLDEGHGDKAATLMRVHIRDWEPVFSAGIRQFREAAENHAAGAKR